MYIYIYWKGEKLMLQWRILTRRLKHALFVNLNNKNKTQCDTRLKNLRIVTLICVLPFWRIDITIATPTADIKQKQILILKNINNNVIN